MFLIFCFTACASCWGLRWSNIPRKDCLYQGVLGLGMCPPNQLCPGWFPPDDGEIDREDIPQKIRRVFSTVSSATCAPRGSGCRPSRNKPHALAIIDGEDHPVPIRPGQYVVFRRETDGTDYSVPLPMALPEEIFNWIVSYDSLPKPYSIGFLGSTQDDGRRRFIEQLAALYPDGLFSASVVPSEQNPFPRGATDATTTTVSCRNAASCFPLPGPGTTRFASGKMPPAMRSMCLSGFPCSFPMISRMERAILRFDGIDQLRAVVDSVLEGRISESDIIINGRKNLIRNHFTQHRAAYLLDQVRSMLGAVQRVG